MTLQEELSVELWVLDAVLTGKDPRSNMQSQKLLDVEKFVFGELYYLSDGGYSRVYVHELRKLCLASESRDEVKAAWQKHSVEMIVWRIELLISKAKAAM